MTRKLNLLGKISQNSQEGPSIWALFLIAEKMTDHFVKCYHGTTKQSVEGILASQSFFVTAKPHHWLGKGAYFFQDAPLQAWYWARKLCGHIDDGSAEPAVLMVEVNLKNCLDLLDLSTHPLLQKAYTMHTKVRASRGENESDKSPLKQDPPVISRSDGTKYHFFSGTPKTSGIPGKNILDNEIIKIASGIYKKKFGMRPSSVRAAFVEGHELYSDTYFYDRYHIQIAISERKRATFDGSPDGLCRNVQLIDSTELARGFGNARVERWPKASNS